MVYGCPCLLLLEALHVSAHCLFRTLGILELVRQLILLLLSFETIKPLLKFRTLNPHPFSDAP